MASDNSATSILRKIGLTPAQRTLLDTVAGSVTASQIINAASTSATTTEIDQLDVTDATVGTVGTAANGTITLVSTRVGPRVRSTLTLTDAEIPVVDAGVSGSYGTLKLMDFPAGVIAICNTMQRYSAFGVDETGVQNDTVMEIALGTSAIAAAADGVLATANKDIGANIAVTLSGGTGTGLALTVGSKIFDGHSANALDLNLNWSGTAATVDANGFITVTGNIVVDWINLGAV